MPHDVDPANWLAYLDAASIKVQLAEYHLLRLSKGQPLSQYSHAVQAEFEGIMYSLVAASDQLGEAINIGLRIVTIQVSSSSVG
jgi:hypothetical protein